MPYAALWCDLHRVDVWELLPPRVAQFYHGEDFSELSTVESGTATRNRARLLDMIRVVYPGSIRILAALQVAHV
jgi:hypothetical protein